MPGARSERSPGAWASAPAASPCARSSACSSPFRWRPATRRFVACIGLSIGARALQAIAQQGLGLFLGGVVVTLMPLLVTTFVGWRLLRMNPVILCGALAGAQTNAAVLSALNEAADSSTPVLGLTLPSRSTTCC